MIDRRTFLKRASVAALPLALGGRPSLAATEEKPTMHPIGVSNEWGKLREVIVGVLPEDAIVATPTQLAYEYLRGSPETKSLKNRELANKQNESKIKHYSKIREISE